MMKKTTMIKTAIICIAAATFVLGSIIIIVKATNDDFKRLEENMNTNSIKSEKPLDSVGEETITFSFDSGVSSTPYSFRPYIEMPWLDNSCYFGEMKYKRLKCEYCGCENNKDYGVCEYCGAPLATRINNSDILNQIKTAGVLTQNRCH